MTLLQNNRRTSRKIAISGVLSALALILGYIETNVCLPNKVSLKVVGKGKEAEYDVIGK